MAGVSPTVVNSTDPSGRAKVNVRDDPKRPALIGSSINCLSDAMKTSPDWSTATVEAPDILRSGLFVTLLSEATEAVEPAPAFPAHNRDGVVVVAGASTAATPASRAVRLPDGMVTPPDVT